MARKRAAAREPLPPTADISDISPARTLLLHEIPDFLNDRLNLDRPINPQLPYDWWKRHKAGRLSVPLPRPIRMIGLGPMFRATEILKWYLEYRNTGGRWGRGH